MTDTLIRYAQQYETVDFLQGMRVESLARIIAMTDDSIVFG